MSAIRARAVRVAEAMCGTTRTFGACRQRVVGRRRLGVRDVERRAGDAPLVQGGDERRLVDDRAARRVHEDRGGLHDRQRRGVDEVVRGVGEREVQRDDVGARERRVEVGVAADRLDLEPEGARALGHRGADAPRPDEREPGAAQLEAQPPAGLPRAPAPVAHVRRGGDEVPRRRQDEREREVGRAVGEDVGGDADRDPARRARGDVDVVRADGVVRHHPQRRRRVEQLVVDAVGQQAEQALRPGGERAQLARRGRELAGPHPDVVTGLPQAVDGGARQRAGDDGAGHGGAGFCPDRAG